MRTRVMKQRISRARHPFLAATFVLAVPSIALADDLSVPVPPAAVVQVAGCLVPDDPTPIVIDQGGTGPGEVAVTLLGAPEAGGTAVSDGGSMIVRTVSPAATPGLSSDPMIAVTVAVSDQVPAGATVNLTLGSATPSGLPSTSPCAPSLVNQNVNAPVSITDVLPGGGLLPAGSLVVVVGNGFQPGAQVLIDGVSLASTSWVDSSRIEVVTAADVQLDGKLVSVINPDLTGTSYVSYLRATDLGASANPLIAATQPIFPLQTLSSAVLTMPTSGTFFGISLQNPDPSDSVVSVDLLDAGLLVASATLALPSRTKISQDVSEVFPSVTPSAGSVFQLTATVPVQVLGLSGNESDGSVTAVLPAPPDPNAPAAQ